jgi:PKD repeat protein
VEPQKSEYAVGEPIFFTATQAVGVSQQPIARYEWDFGDERVSTAVGRSVQHVYVLGNDYTVTLVTTESVSGAVESCTVDIRVR